MAGYLRQLPLILWPSKKPARRFLDIPAEKPKATGLFNGFWVGPLLRVGRMTTLSTSARMALLTLSKRADSAGERVFWSSNPTPHRSEVLVVEFRDFGEEISQHNQPVYVPL